MMNLKHIGRLKSSKRRLVVPYRTIPSDPYSCLVVFIDTLSADEHDSLMRVVESNAGQQAYELAEIMHRSFLPDGRNMLGGFFKTGKLQKIATSDVEMVPDTRNSVSLDELNQLIASQRGVSLEDLALKPENDTAKTSEVVEKTNAADRKSVVEDAVAPISQPLSDEDLARKYRSDADRLSKEAASLRRMAEELVPLKKKATTVKKPSVKNQESVG
jgi:hypothetical protein